jgi:hypothetical protein
MSPYTFPTSFQLMARTCLEFFVHRSQVTCFLSQFDDGGVPISTTRGRPRLERTQILSRLAVDIYRISLTVYKLLEVNDLAGKLGYHG